MCSGWSTIRTAQRASRCYSVQQVRRRDVDIPLAVATRVWHADLRSQKGFSLLLDLAAFILGSPASARMRIPCG